MKTFNVMLRNELKTSLRGMDMIIFAIIMPLVVLVILGMVFGAKPAFEGAEYTFLEQSFGALTSIAICAGGVMGLPLMVSDYRSKHILKRYQVTPISPVIVLIVEVAMYAIYAAISLISLFIVAALFFGYQMKGKIGLFLLGWLLVMISIFSIGLMVGGIAKNSKSAGVIASILYFPMLVFSGATLPYEVMPTAVQHVVNVFPLTQGIKILKNVTLGLPIEDAGISILVIIGVAVICTFIGIRCFKWE
ncbi:MAG TPA: ABC transporter permease [Lachnospiraceae bacterium]|nr:ABC transporter permease [Lachnospiraceae bacterium]